MAQDERQRRRGQSMVQRAARSQMRQWRKRSLMPGNNSARAAPAERWSPSRCRRLTRLSFVRPMISLIWIPEEAFDRPWYAEGG